MKTFLRKTLSLLLVAALCASMGLTALASDALGQDLTAEDVLLNHQTELSTNVFWSSAYSDLRTENLVTYSPNADVTPIVTFGDVLTSRSTVSSMARNLEAQGYRVVAGINGDFYNTSTGLPIGMVVTDGLLRSSDAGYYAVGFRADGTAVLGRPSVTVTADLGYQTADTTGYVSEVVRQLTGVNKARVSTGGIYLYTYDFNDRHTTGNTEAGVDVVCTVLDGQLSIGDTLTLAVDQVLEASSATAIGENQVVLSANALSSSYHTDALRSIPVGSTVTLTVSAASDEWNDVDYAVGALYSLVENGSVVSGLQAGVNPRTAVGQKRDGTLVFYTIDGRKSGHSIGASLTQVAQRLIELGCVTALCLDGGGSTTMAVTEPDDTTASTVNTPSEGSERAVTNHLFLVATSQPSGRLSHFYVNADHSYVLAGSKVNISAAAVDTNYIPMDERYTLRTDGGSLDGTVLTTPTSGGDVTVTASSGGHRGETVVHAIRTPDDVAIRNSASTIITTLNVSPGSTTALTATAAYQHRSLKADPEAFTWSVTGSIGTVDAAGVFTATTPGSGTVTVSAGGVSAAVNVTVSSSALQTVEDFEGTTTIFRGSGSGMDFSLNHGADSVRMGQGSARVDYDLNVENGFGSGQFVTEWRAGTFTEVNNSMYTSLNLWVYGDGSGNVLQLLYGNGTKSYLPTLGTTLDFTGWRQVTVSTAGDAFSIQGLRIVAPSVDGVAYADTARTGAVYIDHIVASFAGTVDNTPPAVTLTPSGDQLTALVTDAMDGVVPRANITVTWDGAAQDFTYNESTGELTTSLLSDGRGHRITVTAKDASGNLGRASYDVAATDGAHYFTDIDSFWAASSVDFLYTANITTGYEDGTFRPDQYISRQQFAVMLYRYLGLDGTRYESVQLPFADNGSIGSYALTAIKALYTEGIINGATGRDGRLYFNPGASLTRAQAATMIGRTQAKGYATVDLTFSDSSQIPAYATFYIQTMAAQGVIGGYTDGTFRPNNNITRGQMAKILYNLI